MRILIAEDDPLDRELLCAYLSSWGHEVAVCEDGASAWERMQAPDAPRLLLLDWMMPEPDGPTLCRRLRASVGAEQIYIIMVTGKSRREDVIAGLGAGADDYVKKPFDEGELRARLQVGERVVDLWERLLEAERMRVLLQTAGAAAHEINQPLSIILGQSQLLQMDRSLGEAQREKLQGINKAVKRIGDIVQRMTSVRQYATRRYVEDIDIVDFGDDVKDPT